MRTITSILIILSLMGCEKELQFDNPDFKPKLVINGFMSADSTVSIGLSKSSSTLSQPSLKLLSGKAKVLILKDKFLLFSDSVNIQNGMIQLPFKPLEGSKYEVQVSKEDLPTIKAIDTVPQSRPIAAIDTIIADGSGQKMIVRINDDVRENRYLLSIKLKGRELIGLDSLDKSYNVSFTSSDKIFLSNIQTVANGSEVAICNDETWNGSERRIELFFDKILLEHPDFKAASVQFHIKDISKTMYNYYIAVNANTHVYGGPLANVSRVKGNVEQGLGAFCFYTESVSSVALP